MARIATYARISVETREEEGKSIPAQQAEMREWAAARGHEIVAEFADSGFTGTDMERPGLQSLLMAAESRVFDILLVHELSRLSRSIFDTFRIFELLGKLNIGFASVKDPDFDFSSSTGRFFLTIIAALNQYYVDLVRMHTAKAKRERAREGLYNASITPYGYRHAGDANTPPVIVEAEAAAVREMFARYATGHVSYEEIADWLNDAGYRTRSGRRFSKDTVADMLRNPFYKGFIAYRQGSRDQEAGELFPGKHEPIVSAEVWEMCRRVREQRRSAPRTYQPQYRVYLLNSIAACDVCGRKLRAQGAASGDYYREMSAQRGFVDCPSARRGVRAEVVERQIGAIFRQLRLPDDWQARLVEIAALDDDQPTLENRRARLTAERRRLKEAWIRGEFEGEDEDIYRRELERIRRELAELPEPGDLEAVERAAAMLSELAAVWDEADAGDRRDLLRIALREVKVDMAEGRVTTIEPYPVFTPLFRQIPLLREIAFGVFVPLWAPENVAALEIGLTLPPLTARPEPSAASDWPLLINLPEEIIGQRITPALSDWLKERRRGGEGAGVVAELIHPSVPPLRVDQRKWPDVSVERLSTLRSTSGVSFLWTPFALQREGEKGALVEAVQRALVSGGTWAFVDVMPSAMAGHWLYRFFPQAWEIERRSTWDASQMYNRLVEAGFRVELRRRSIYQAVALGVAREIAGERERCPQLKSLPDEVYTAGLAALGGAIARAGVEGQVGSHVCLVEVVAVR